MEKVPDRNARALAFDPPSDGKDLRGKVVARALLAAFVLLTMIVYGRISPKSSPAGIWGHIGRYWTQRIPWL